MHKYSLSNGDNRDQFPSALAKLVQVIVHVFGIDLLIVFFYGVPYTGFEPLRDKKLINPSIHRSPNYDGEALEKVRSVRSTRTKSKRGKVQSRRGLQVGSYDEQDTMSCLPQSGGGAA
jgi:hypothetical protein